MILAGIILGPYALNLLSPSLLSISVELRQIALVIILMCAGLALDLEDLKKYGRPAFLMCFVPACFEIMGMIIIAPLLLNVTYLEAAIMGAVVAAVSPAIIVPKMLFLIENKIGTKKGIPQTIMAGGSVDDVFVIVLFSVFTSLAVGDSVSAATFLQIPVSIACGLVLGVVTGIALITLFRRVHMRDSVKLLIMLNAAFLFMALEQQLKGVVPISALLAVITLGICILKKYPVLAKRISPKFSKLWVAAEVMLFVLVGATVDLQYATSAGFAAIAVIIFAALLRMTGVLICMIKTPLSLKERVFCMIAYLPKATVQAAIGSMPLAMGLSCGNIVLTVAVLAILITAPLGALGIEATYKKLLVSD